MKTNTIKIAVDVVITLTLVLLYNIRAVIGLPFHEWAGILIAVGFLIHVVLSWDWVVTVTKGILGRATARAKLLWVVDVLVLVAMLWTILSGVFISRIALPGLAQTSTTLWRATHVPVSWLTLLLIGLHLGLHWQWVMNVVRKLLKRGRSSPGLVLGLRVAAGVVFAAGVYACVVTDAFGQAARSFTGGTTEHGTTTTGLPGSGATSGVPGTGHGPGMGPGNGQGHGAGMGTGPVGDGASTLSTLLLATGVVATLAVPVHYADQALLAAKRRRRRRPGAAPSAAAPA